MLKGFRGSLSVMFARQCYFASISEDETKYN